MSPPNTAGARKRPCVSAACWDAEAALLKERSPSCGSGMVYDGTFTGVLTAGEGVTAELLRAQGIPVYGESRVAELADPT